MGNDKYKAIYKEQNADHKGDLIENCGALQKWVSDSYVKDWTNVVIIVPKNLWCAKSNEGVVEMIQGRLVELQDPTMGKHKLFALDQERPAFL